MSRPADDRLHRLLLAGPELLEAEHLAGELADAAGADARPSAPAGLSAGVSEGKQEAPSAPPRRS